MTMTLIETKTLGTATASIEFISIPQTFTDLVLLISARSTGTASTGGAFVALRPNGLTSSITARTLRGLGSGSVQSNSETAIIIRINPTDTTAATFSNSNAYIPNYAGGTNKSFSVDGTFENNATAAQQELLAGLHSNTSAITSLSFFAGAGDLVVGSTISLYGILKGSDGIVTTTP